MGTSSQVSLPVADTAMVPGHSTARRSGASVMTPTAAPGHNSHTLRAATVTIAVSPALRRWCALGSISTRLTVEACTLPLEQILHTRHHPAEPELTAQPDGEHRHHPVPNRGDLSCHPGRSPHTGHEPAAGKPPESNV